jgi:hypothetical protein
MKERPIIFSGPMVRAILDGRKTQTRRVVKQAFGQCGDGMGPVARVCEPCTESGFRAVYTDDMDPGWKPLRLPGRHGFPCPYGVPGDRLWVRETWAPGWTYGGACHCVFYRSDGSGWIGDSDHPVTAVSRGEFGLTEGGPSCSAPSRTKWRPSIHMPRWASRITLEVTDVRVERVRSISASDALAEGSYLGKCPCLSDRPPRDYFDAAFQQHWCHVHGDEFTRLWDSINASRGYGWNTNPWVWAVEFRVLP